MKTIHSKLQQILDKMQKITLKGRHMNVFFLFLFIIFSITGCGGGGGDSSAESTGPSSSGIFIDARVQGLDYTCSSGGNGTTDSNGAFTCHSGDNITFYANGVFLGTTAVADVISPHTLWANNAIATNVAQLLQTLDQDNANTNLIVIGSTSLDVTLDVRDTSGTFDANLDNNTTNSMITDAIAEANMDISLALEVLTFDTIKQANTAEDIIVGDLNLSTSGAHTTNIAWTSTDTNIVSTDGSVTHPHANDTNITLTATISKAGVSRTKTFTLTIKTIPDNDHDNIPDSIEALLGFDSGNDDENNNGIADGIDPEFGDPFYKNQWHIKARGTVVNNTASVATIVGNDLGLDEVYKRYMGYNNGNPIIVSVVDNGTDADHEDLADNMDLTRSYNVENNSTDPSPTGDETHGTMVAGIIAARGFNGKGVRGIAPFAKIAGNNWLSNQTADELERAWVTGVGANDIAISSNSWGADFDNSTFLEALLKVGAQTLRDGKGRIYVKAAGNERNARGNSNLSNTSNNPYIIAVAALKHDNTHASYSSFGSNILISGYSGDFFNTAPTIGTTITAGDTSLPTWDDDIQGHDTLHNYTYAMNGTSAATPIVAGSIALILEACPTLTYRDVKYILAKTGTKIDSSASTWVQNGAGLWHSIDYGYGLVNTQGAIALCQNAYTSLGGEQHATNTLTFNTPIPDNDSTGVSFTVPISESFSLEWVGVKIDMHDHTYQGDLEVTLRSPQGTITTLIQGNNILKSSGDTDSGFYNGNGRLSSSAFIDEDSQGDWVVTVKDLAGVDTGTVFNIKIDAIGH